MVDSYVIWTEGGGQGKTTLASGLAKAHERHGHDVLVIDMDGQKGGLTTHYGLMNETQTTQGNDIVDFLAWGGATDTDMEDIRNLVRTHNGVDVLPSCPGLRDLEKQIKLRGEPFAADNPDKMLRRIVAETGLAAEYDIVIVDAPKGCQCPTKNGLYLARNILMPIEPDEKGLRSMDGIIENVYTFSREKQIQCGFISVVLNKVPTNLSLATDVEDGLNDWINKYSESQAGYDFPIAPIKFRDTPALFKGAFKAHMDPFTFYRDHKDRQYDSDRRTLNLLDLLSEYVVYHLKDVDGGRIPAESEIGQVPSDAELFEAEQTSDSELTEKTAPTNTQ